MSSNPNDTITLQNYEEFFVLYLDNELDPAQREMVDDFLAEHPDLKTELELLQGTKLEPTGAGFGDKQLLFADAMKLNAVDEDLLLYVDDELSAAEKKSFEQKLAGNTDYAAQHALLLKTKLDPTESVPYPNKEELYRRTERRIVFAPWMRIAAAVILLLFVSLTFLVTRKDNAVENNGLATTTSSTQSTKANPEANNPPVVLQPNDNRNTTAQSHSLPAKQVNPTITERKSTAENPQPAPMIGGERSQEQDVALVPIQRPVVKFDVSRFTASEVRPDGVVVVNEPLSREPVTSGLTERTPIEEGTPETAGSDADFKDTKKTPAKGFFRKVSRFIERRTGIGTVNEDNELLIGAVALKLK